MNTQRSMESRAKEASCVGAVLAGLLAVFLPATATIAQPGATREGVVYVASNNPIPDGNSVLAYRRDARGSLSPLPASPFRTGGKGYATKIALPHFGPFDLDQNIIVNENRTRLFVTNGGSDSIAVFDILDDGSLRPVTGSPFPSGGKNPVSLGLVGDRLYVVNKNEDPMRDMTRTRPNYTGFNIGRDGSLTPIPGSTVELAKSWRSPTQALVVEDRFIYDADFGRFPLASRVTMWGESLKSDSPSMIRSLQIKRDGTLSLLEELPAAPGEFDGGLDVDEDGDADPLMFGLQVHPQQKLIYVSYVSAAKLAVYSYDDAGRLTFVRAVPNKGQLICWVAINETGTRAYTTNNGDDTVSVYDLGDPTYPLELQTLHLKGHGHPYQLALDSKEAFLYIVKHRTFDETPLGDGSVLNVLKVLPDGTLQEVGSSPETLPVRDDLLARPQGVAAL